MIVNLTLKPTTYKAVKINSNSYHDLVELFGTTMVTVEQNFAINKSITVNIPNSDTVEVPTTEGIIIVVEYFNNEVTGVFASDSTDDLRNMFDWEGEL